MKTGKYIRTFLLVISALLLHLFILSPVQAKDDYALKTGKGCIFCHQESTGGPLKSVGFAYIKGGYQYPISERILTKVASLQTPFHATLRFIIGYLHLLAAVIFFGAIFYIHIFIRPSRLTGGIPKYERILGVSCMTTLALTGVYLTWARIDTWGQFFTNTFGLMLFIKILLFLLMVAIGITAITLIHRRMQKEAKAANIPVKGDTITLGSLSSFDGSAGKPGYVVFKNKIYDVSDNQKWNNGRHFGKHSAGSDLTDALEGAPHGPEVFENVRYVGDISEKQPTTQKISSTRRIFIIMAYANLVIIFLILACISIWRWGFPVRLIPEARSDVIAGSTCIECHKA